jgi:hypothetical protein
MMLAGCSTTSSTTFVSPLPNNVVIIQNEGYICFHEIENSLEARGYFIPKGCFSSSCTRPIRQTIDIMVDTAQFAIRFNTLFVLIDPYAAQGKPRGSYACTDDCGGAGSIQFDIGDLERGTYSVWLGERNLGQISFPPNIITGRDICFGKQW